MGDHLSGVAIRKGLSLAEDISRVQAHLSLQG